MKEKTIALSSPHHDPNGSLLKGLHSQISVLKSIFDTVAVSVSDLTDPRVLRDFDLFGIHYQVRKENGNVSDRYRQALKLGFDDGIDTTLLLDFDRALHWATAFPDEMRIVADQIRNNDGFTSLQRSQRAFETHPLVQRETEVVVNQIASEIVGKRVDVLSGGYGLDKESSNIVLKKATAADFGFYGQILAVNFYEGIRINTVEVEGLEWETPDQYKDQINIVGYSQWLSNFQSLSEWEKRLTISFEAGSALQKL